jgi:hypothetical protein
LAELKGKAILALSSRAKSRAQTQQLCEGAQAAGADATLVSVDVGKHDFPSSTFGAVREWLRGPALGAATPEANGGVKW